MVLVAPQRSHPTAPPTKKGVWPIGMLRAHGGSWGLPPLEPHGAATTAALPTGGRAAEMALQASAAASAFVLRTMRTSLARCLKA
eukprot:6565255-Lingulodinium_polyedra.AAC.1